MRSVNYVKQAESKIKSNTNHKLARFEEYMGMMKTLALQGSDKYTCEETDEKEFIDVILDVLGEKGFTYYVLGDFIKRVIRLKNQKRERDLPKIGLWSYFLWDKLFPKTSTKSNVTQHS